MEVEKEWWAAQRLINKVMTDISESYGNIGATNLKTEELVT